MDRPPTPPSRAAPKRALMDETLFVELAKRPMERILVAHSDPIEARPAAQLEKAWRRGMGVRGEEGYPPASAVAVGTWLRIRSGPLVALWEP